MRRIAPLLADLFVRHGLTVDSTDGALLTVSGSNGTLLVSGDLSGAPVDNATLAALVSTCDEGASQGLFIHDGPVTAAALRAAGTQIHLWSTDALAHWLGNAELATALGRPLPALPLLQASRPQPNPTTATPEPEAVAEAELEATNLEELEVIDLTDDEDDSEQTDAETESEAETSIETLAIPFAFGAELSDVAADEPEPMFIDLPLSALADVQELTESTPAEPFIELEDETPVLHLEDADGSLVEVEPADADATDGPDVISLQDLVMPAPEPAIDVLAEPEFEVPAVNDLLPPAFREAPQVTVAPEPAGLELPAAFQANERDAVRAPDGSQGLLPPRVTLDEAKAMVTDRLFSIEEAELILQPVHLFDYQVDLLQPGKLSAQPVRGRLQVNGTDRHVTATDAAKCDSRLPHRVWQDDTLTVMDKVLRVSPDRAEQLAKVWATAEHAKTVQVTTNRADDSYAVTEARDVAPTSGQVHLTPLGLWHRPFWRLWGDNGHVDIDAVEGTLLDEEIKTPNPDFLLLE